MKKFSELGIRPKTLTGEKIAKEDILGKEITVLAFRVEESKFNRKNEDSECLHLQIEFEGKTRVAFLGSAVLIDQIRQVPEQEFPFKTTIIKEMKWYKFT
jgi:hypothetical protein